MSRDDCDLLLSVELLIKFEIFSRDLPDVHETLALAANFDESVGHIVEIAEFSQCIIELSNLFLADASVSREEFESFTVLVQFEDIRHVLVDIVERISL